MRRSGREAAPRIDRATVATRGLLTIEEAADFLALHRSTAYRMTKDGRLPSVRLGGCVRVPASAALAIADGKSTFTTLEEGTYVVKDR